MQMIYDSDSYCVIEFSIDDQHAILSADGYKIVGKDLKREIFLGGELAGHFREDVKRLIANEPTVEEIDNFLGKFNTVMTQPIAVH